MRRLILVIALVGCASNAPPRVDPGTQRQATIFSGPDTPTLFADRPRVFSLTIQKPVDVVWPAVKRAYADLEVPVTVDNPKSSQIGNTDFYKTRLFAGKLMSEYVDCGSGLTGPRSTSLRIYMSLITSVASDGKGGTTLATAFSPAGRDMTGPSTERTVCGTTGKLEKLLMERVRMSLGQ